MGQLFIIMYVLLSTTYDFLVFLCSLLSQYTFSSENMFGTCHLFVILEQLDSGSSIRLINCEISVFLYIFLPDTRVYL